MDESISSIGDGVEFYLVGLQLRLLANTGTPGRQNQDYIVYHNDIDRFLVF